MLNNFINFLNPIAVAHAETLPIPTKPIDTSAPLPTFGYLQLPPITIPPGAKIAFVAGLFDATTEIVKTAADDYAARHPGQSQYFSWLDGQALQDYITANNGNVVVISHSYGADTAASRVAHLPFEIAALVTLDPVSLNTPSYAAVAAHAKVWYDYNAVGGSGLQLSNTVASVGGDWGQSISKLTPYFYNVNLNHGQIGTEAMIFHLFGQ